MTTIEGLARALCVSDRRREFDCCGRCGDKLRQARVAWAHTLAALREHHPLSGWTGTAESFLDAFERENLPASAGNAPVSYTPREVSHGDD